MIFPSRKVLIWILNSQSVCVTSLLRLLALIFAPAQYYPSWAGQPIAVWSAIEANLALICSCLPTLRPFAAKVWRSVKPHSMPKIRISHLSGKLRTRSTGQTTKSKLSEKMGSAAQQISREHSAKMAPGSIGIESSYEVSHVKGAV